MQLNDTRPLAATMIFKSYRYVIKSNHGDFGNLSSPDSVLHNGYQNLMISRDIWIILMTIGDNSRSVVTKCRFTHLSFPPPCHLYQCVSYSRRLCKLVAYAIVLPYVCICLMTYLDTCISNCIFHLSNIILIQPNNFVLPFSIEIVLFLDNCYAEGCVP